MSVVIDKVSLNAFGSFGLATAFGIAEGVMVTAVDPPIGTLTMVAAGPESVNGEVLPPASVAVRTLNARLPTFEIVSVCVVPVAPQSTRPRRVGSVALGFVPK